MSAMRETIWSQPEELGRILADPGPAARAAERLVGRRTLLVGTGTSWHAAGHGAYFLREAGVDALAVQGVEADLHGPRPGPGDGLILLTHRGTKRHTSNVAARAREDGAAIVQISAIGGPGADLETVPGERSAAFTASHTGALARLAQIAVELGADLGELADVPDALEAVLADCPLPAPPDRLLELTGAGPNRWTAAEGSLKVRETARIAAEGLSVEQLLHGPSVALGSGDALVCLDGGGPGSERLAELASLVESYGAAVHRYRFDQLGEQLSVFPLTVVVQLIALTMAEQLGTDPDAFGRDIPGRGEQLSKITL
jgi:glucosamine--fructose-6-phosphate aminotransferase (isomerizing)